jgi:hypothetical protein
MGSNFLHSLTSKRNFFFFLSGLVRYLLTSLTQPPNPFSNKKIGSTFFFYFILYNNYYFHFSGGWGGVCSLRIINFLCYGPSHRPMTTSKGGRRTREREREKKKFFPTYLYHAFLLQFILENFEHSNLISI